MVMDLDFELAVIIHVITRITHEAAACSPASADLRLLVGYP